jgi:hypothetical protein
MEGNRSCGTTRIHDTKQTSAGRDHAVLQHYPANISEASRCEFEYLMTSMGFRENCPDELRVERHTSS